tara:strand:+ start:829 stop:1416 length:588 start_codon:yes stop_codon:yes gene_type:complete
MAQEEQMMQQQGMPPEGAPMPPEGGATPEQAVDAQMQAQQAQIEQIAATAPMPDKPYTYKAIDKMADAMNDFVGKVDPAMQAAEYNPPEGEKKLDGSLPPEVYVPFAVIMGFISQMGGFEKYLMNPEELVSDTALAKASANFKRMGKDKKLMEGLKTPAEAPEDEEQMEMSEAEMETGRMPDDVSPEDEEIMNMM